jgi:hypothetical protein
MNLKTYAEQYDSISICFCILERSIEHNKIANRLLKIQEELSSLNLPIRQCYVYGNQTVTATKFTKFYPERYTTVEVSKNPYEYSEALALAFGMIKEEENLAIKEQWENHRNLLIVLGNSNEKDEAFSSICSWIESEKSHANCEILEG